jgi:demethylmenaquinone methyltransferase/2-methoxy-6-polyprenyl-1,4-benzoquinol methylase
MNMTANLEKDPNQISNMFDGVAKNYDLLNDLLSFGQTKRWRRIVTSIISPKPGMKILDLAAGTGSSSEPLRKKGADVVAADFSDGMLEVGKRKHPNLKFVKADALALPFADQSFDLVTISFGLRNTNDAEKALNEMHRVTKINGKLVIVEFSHPTNKFFRNFYFRYLMKILPLLSRLFAKDSSAYVYLANSIKAWPNQSNLAKLLMKSGWQDVTWQDLTFGIVAVHIAQRSI